MEAEISAPFTSDKRRAFDTFFAKYGSHFVRRVWVGGKADLTFTIAKSAEMSKADIQAGIAASYGAVGQGKQGEYESSGEQGKAAS